MKLTISILNIRLYTIVLKYAFLLWFILLVNLGHAQILNPPTVTFEPSCGSGNITLTAESKVIDNDLVFIWYDKDSTVLGQEKGANGSDEFITPFLIQNETFYVSLELNGFTSNLEKVSLEVIHTPKILEEPWIQLCDSVVLHGSIEVLDTFNSISYQWQELTAKDLAEVSFQDIEGENDLTLSVTAIGIFRLVVLLDDCMAISSNVEVTGNLVANALPTGQNNYCYTKGFNYGSVPFINSHYRNDVTTLAWYRSDDGGINYPVLFSTNDTVKIVKPSSIIDTNETWNYRLEVTEQNCSDRNDFVIAWNARPRGSIRRKIDASEDNFFYCEDDDANTRTLEAISDDNVSVTWYRLLNTKYSKEDHESVSFDLGRSLVDSLNKFNAIGTGNEIVLDQSMGGLIIATFFDLDNGCKEYSSNAIFADTAFPIATTLFENPDLLSYRYNAVCSGITNLEMSSWDNTADKFFWYFAEDSINYVLVGTAETYLMNTVDHSGDIAGFYKMGVEKNGCYAESDPFYIFEGDPVASTIEASSTQFCETIDITLSSQNKNSRYTYNWYETSKPDSTLSIDTIFYPQEVGSYVLELNNIFCTTLSDPIEIIQLSIPEANFSSPVDTGEKFCSTLHTELTEQSVDNTYEWYRSSNNFTFSQIADESALDYLIIEKGFYFSTVTNTNGCQVNSDTIRITEVLDDELNYKEVAYMCFDDEEILLSLKSPRSNQSYRWLYSLGSIDAYVYTDASGINDLSTYKTTKLGYYRLELTGENCVVTTDPIEVRAAPAGSDIDVIIEASSTEFCQTSDIILSSQNKNALYTYSWYTSSKPDSVLGSNAIFNPQEAGSYILELNNGFCTGQSDTTEIIQLSIPKANFSNSFDTKEKICTTIDAQLIEQNTDNTYAWYRSSDAANFSAMEGESALGYSLMEEGFYFATVTNTNGCQVNSDTIQFAGFLNAELNYDKVAHTCASDEETLLWIKSPQSNKTYRWLYSPDNIIAYTEAEGTNDLVIYQAKELGHYRLEMTSEDCVLTTDPIELQLNSGESELEAVIIGETSVCSSSPITLSIDNSGFESSYIWLYSTPKGELTPFQGGQEKTITIEASQFTSDLNPTQEVKIYLGVQEGNCSKLSKPLSVQSVKESEIIVRDEINNSTLDLFICDIQNTSSNLEAFQVTANNSIDYQWLVYNPQTLSFDSIENENLNVLNVTSSGLYQCVGTVPGSTCATTSNTLEVITPPRKISGDTTFCYGGVFDIKVNQEFLFDNAYNNFDYQWYYSGDNQTFDAIDTAQSTSLKVFSGEERINGGYFYYSASYNSCEILSDTLFVKEDEASVRITILGEPVQTKGEAFEVSVITDQEENMVTWKPAEYGLNSSIDHAVFTIPEDYTDNQIEIVAQITNESCASAQSFLINLISSESLTFSKMITPNGNNYNDTFRVIGLDQSTSNTLRIFDGWGKMIYEIKDYDNTPAASSQLTENIEAGNFYYVFYTGNQTYKGNFYVKK